MAAFHVGLGLSITEIEERLSRLTTRSLFALGFALREWGSLSRRARRAVGELQAPLELLRDLRLDPLHFGVRRLGLLAMDLPRGEEIFAATGLPCPVPPGSIVLGGISIPGLFPVVRVEAEGRTYRLADGGFSHSVPVERAFEEPFLAERVLAVDLQVIRGFRERRRDRWKALGERHGGRLVRLLPDVGAVGTVFFRREQAADLVRAGEACVTKEVLARLTLSRGGC